MIARTSCAGAATCDGLFSTSAAPRSGNLTFACVLNRTRAFGISVRNCVGQSACDTSINGGVAARSSSSSLTLSDSACDANAKRDRDSFALVAEVDVAVVADALGAATVAAAAVVDDVVADDGAAVVAAEAAAGVGVAAAGMAAPADEVRPLLAMSAHAMSPVLLGVEIDGAGAAAGVAAAAARVGTVHVPHVDCAAAAAAAAAELLLGGL